MSQVKKYFRFMIDSDNIVFSWWKFIHYFRSPWPQSGLDHCSRSPWSGKLPKLASRCILWDACRGWPACQPVRVWTRKTDLPVSLWRHAPAWVNVSEPKPSGSQQNTINASCRWHKVTGWPREFNFTLNDRLPHVLKLPLNLMFEEEFHYLFPQ